MKFESLYQKNFPKELWDLIDLIDDLFEQLETDFPKIRWKKRDSIIEYGFYIENADKTRNIFCGIWFELWINTQYPFVMSIDWTTKSDSAIGYLVRDCIKQLQDEKLRVIDYENSPVVLFEKEFFTDTNITEKIMSTIKALADRLGIG